jgi:hypothetical protein
MSIELIKCQSCGAPLKITQESGFVRCEYCGCQNRVVGDIETVEEPQSKVVIIASNEFIGLAGVYNIYDNQKKKIAAIQANEVWSMEIKKDTSFYAKYSGAFTRPQEIKCFANQLNKFYITIVNGGFGKGFSISPAD